MTRWQAANQTPEQFGFKWDNVIVQRCASHNGHKWIDVITDAGVVLQIHISPKGRSIRTAITKEPVIEAEFVHIIPLQIEGKQGESVDA